MQWETSITEQCIWTAMLKTVNQWEKTMGQSAARCLSLFLEQPTWMGGKRLVLHNALILFSCIILIYHLLSQVGSKNPVRHQLTQSRSMSVPSCSRNQSLDFLLLSSQHSTTGDWGWESEEWPRVFISSHLPTDLWSTVVLYFKALIVSDQCRNIP